MNISKTYIETPLGEMIACATDKGICLLEFNNRKNIDGQFQKTEKELNGVIVEENSTYFDLLKKELDAYFKKELKEFTVPLDLVGTEFQKKVWQALLAIPYGKTISYLQQSETMGNPLSVRAVANANGMNKIAIIVPCHRVIGSNGKLTGYAGGLDKKRWLLNLEKGITENTLFE
ncbi:methylated-DNA-[protein]-cysteine S-methyltransferase [Dysgonomonas alginatilytica]|uniref:Methylated-DNA--protein-cysteine methyltransferase n=1 Tax=Dysgonomonas alginatilytica TaxID=1605892 RepID=A0A2V3PM91_9BACT|nr:methylated-DNA--[protein]-cysteine S-methyltransferase [Dysgonomonas alginatilytica]PXV62535.1 methylated-DNA-[protein]-cysteine S-methyltransferase [Dysgonomonas alginatilytica]